MVVSAGSLLSRKVVEIHSGVVPVEDFEVARRVVDGARIGEGIEQVESAGEPLLKLGLKRVVVGESGAPGNFHFAKGLVGPARVERAVLARILGTSLIDVAKDHQLVRAVANVGDVEQ